MNSRNWKPFWRKERKPEVNHQAIDDLNNALRKLFLYKGNAGTVKDAIDWIQLAIFAIPGGYFYKDVYDELTKRGCTIDESRCVG